MTRMAGAAGVAAAVLALAFAGTAAAGKGDVRAATDIGIEAMAETGSRAVAVGSIDSKKPKCLDNRKVRVTLVPLSGPDFAFDVARTGGGGGWFAVHGLDEFEANAPFELIKLQVAGRKLPLPGGRTLICGGTRERQRLPD